MNELELSEMTLIKTALDVQRDTFFIFDPHTGKALFWNKAFRDASGYSDEEIARNKAPDSYYSPDDLVHAAEKISKILAGEAVIFEMDLIAKNGARIPTEYTGAVIASPEGGPQHIISLGRDTTERSATQVLLDERLGFETLVTDLSAMLMNASPQDFDLVIGQALRRIAEFVGAGRAVVIQPENDRTRFRITHVYSANQGAAPPVGTDVTEIFGSVARIVSQGAVLQFSNIAEIPEEASSMRSYCKNEGIQSSVVIPLVVSEQVIGSLSLAVFDQERSWPPALVKRFRLTGELIAGALVRHRTERALRESEAKGRALLAAMPDLMFCFSREGVYLDFYASARSELFVKPEDFVGKRVEEVLPPEVGQACVAHIRRTLDTGQMQVFEYTLYFPDSGERFYEARMMPAAEDKVLVVVRETTERRRLEERLRQAGKMEAIGQMAGGIAHDFNNVLSGIVGFADLILDDVPAGSPSELFARQILKAGLRAKDLVRQILTFSRQGAEEKKALVLTPLVVEVLDLVRASVPSTVAIDADIEEKTSVVFADPTKVHEALMNLVNNAVQAMDEHGELKLRLYDVALTEPQEGRLGPIEPGEYTILEVTDTGSGMDGPTLDKIFDPFFTTKLPGQGTGMGLAVVYGVMKGHQGNVQIDTELGRGTVFRLFFRSLKAGVLEVPDEDKTPIPTGRERVLFVDDEELVLDVCAEMLLSLGYDVVRYSDSAAALACFRANPSICDILITDQTMPVISGFELAKEVLAVRPGLPVILCTGFSSKVDEHTVRAAGIRKLCMKPLGRRELALAVREALDRPADL